MGNLVESWAMSEEEIQRFDPELPVERARTPPASWYRDPEILAREEERVFRSSWILAARSDQLRGPSSFVTGCVAKGMSSDPNTTPISTKISTIPAPEASESESAFPPRRSACLVKKLIVIGIIG